MVYSIQGIRKKVFIFTIKLVIIRTKKSYMEYFFYGYTFTNVICYKRKRLQLVGLPTN